MDLNNPAVTIVIAAITAALSNLLIAWLGRRQSNAQAGVSEAEEERIRVANRHAQEEEGRKKTDHLLSVIERSRDAKVIGLEEADSLRSAEVLSLKDAMAALEKSHAVRVTGLTSEVAGLKQGMEGLTTQIEELATQVVDLKGLMESANETINQQSLALKEANDTIKEQGETIIELNKEVSGLKTLVQTANDTISSLKQLVSDLVDQIKGLGAVPVAATAEQTLAAVNEVGAAESK